MSPRRRVSIGKFFKIHVGYFFFKILTAWVKCLPVASLSSYGGKIGLLTFYLLRRWRRVALNNLNLVFGREKGRDEIQRMCRELFKNMTTDMMEVYRCVDFEDSYFKTLVRFKGKEHLDRALKEGKGAIAVSGHLGNFPLMAARLANEGYPLSLVARDPENPKIAKAILSLRDAVGMESIPDEPRMACVSRCSRL